jgi:hypothetical protein
MGNKVLIISPGTGGKKIIENNDTIATTQPIDIDEILVSLKTTIDNTSILQVIWLRLQQYRIRERNNWKADDG